MKYYKIKKIEDQKQYVSRPLKDDHPFLWLKLCILPEGTKFKPLVYLMTPAAGYGYLCIPEWKRIICMPNMPYPSIFNMF